jgi:predicted enzyme related to lactoylglutathione lyase
MLRISLAELYVDDQDQALAFYTEKVGLQVHTDSSFGPDYRWLTLVSPDEPEGTQLLLARADDTTRQLQEHIRGKGAPAISFSTADVQAEYERLVANGVRFVMEPTKLDYGGTDAVFEDGCGNLINLHQE